MKTTAIVFASGLALTLGLSACAPTPTSSQPRDVGNMAYPAPLPQGNVSTTMPAKTTDTGNMAYPAPLTQGSVGTTAATTPRRPTDTGNMAYPTPAPAGAVGTTVVK
jgi:hypothetical protein